LAGFVLSGGEEYVEAAKATDGIVEFKSETEKGSEGLVEGGKGRGRGGGSVREKTRTSKSGPFFLVSGKYFGSFGWRRRCWCTGRRRGEREETMAWIPFELARRHE